MSRTKRRSVVINRRRRKHRYRADPLVKRKRKVEQVCEKAGKAIVMWQGAWLGEEEDLPAVDGEEWQIVALDDVRFNKHDPDASSLDARRERKRHVDGRAERTS